MVRSAPRSKTSTEPVRAALRASSQSVWRGQGDKEEEEDDHKHAEQHLHISHEPPRPEAEETSGDNKKLYASLPTKNDPGSA